MGYPRCIYIYIKIIIINNNDNNNNNNNNKNKRHQIGTQMGKKSIVNLGSVAYIYIQFLLIYNLDHSIQLPIQLVLL